MGSRCSRYETEPNSFNVIINAMLTLVLLATVSTSRRLTFHSNGTLTDPSGQPVLLRGFTFDYTLKSDAQAEVTDEE